MVLSSIYTFRRKHDYGPTLSEISKETGNPVGTVQGACRKLRDFGFIGWDKGISRSLRILAKEKPLG